MALDLDSMQERQDEAERRGWDDEGALGQCEEYSCPALAEACQDRAALLAEVRRLQEIENGFKSVTGS